ncbi:heparanase-like [Vespula squamosa]|uniref:Heparanase-like n=1 Tax=Vespula squamosa TaxID=30214 RepID=A0ABD2BDM2_VESSQ
MKLSINLIFPMRFKLQRFDCIKNLRMNGEILKLQNDGKLPPFHPIIVNPTQIIILPPFSMVFMVIHGVHAPAYY